MRLSLIIRGRVQGVGYRYSASEQARRLGLCGWVRNTDEGNVELIAEGDEEPLRRLLQWCRSGPSGARVTAIDERWIEATGDLDSFQIRR